MGKCLLELKKYCIMKVGFLGWKQVLFCHLFISMWNYIFYVHHCGKYSFHKFLWIIVPAPLLWITVIRWSNTGCIHSSIICCITMDIFFKTLFYMRPLEEITGRIKYHFDIKIYWMLRFGSFKYLPYVYFIEHLNILINFTLYWMNLMERKIM